MSRNCLEPVGVFRITEQHSQGVDLCFDYPAKDIEVTISHLLRAYNPAFVNMDIEEILDRLPEILRISSVFLYVEASALKSGSWNPVNFTSGSYDENLVDPSGKVTIDRYAKWISDVEESRPDKSSRGYVKYVGVSPNLVSATAIERKFLWFSDQYTGAREQSYYVFKTPISPEYVAYTKYESGPPTTVSRDKPTTYGSREEFTRAEREKTLHLYRIRKFADLVKEAKKGLQKKQRQQTQERQKRQRAQRQERQRVERDLLDFASPLKDKPAERTKYDEDEQLRELFEPSSTARSAPRLPAASARSIVAYGEPKRSAPADRAERQRVERRQRQIAARQRAEKAAREEAEAAQILEKAAREESEAAQILEKTKRESETTRKTRAVEKEPVHLTEKDRAYAREIMYGEEISEPRKATIRKIKIKRLSASTREEKSKKQSAPAHGPTPVGGLHTPKTAPRPLQRHVMIFGALNILIDVRHPLLAMGPFECSSDYGSTGIRRVFEVYGFKEFETLRDFIVWLRYIEIDGHPVQTFTKGLLAVNVLGKELTDEIIGIATPYWIGYQ
jgi:hypothetical protein